MGSVAIPLNTYPTGTRAFGPVSVPDAITSADLIINRTVGAKTWNTTPAATLDLLIEWSTDGGTTWRSVVYVPPIPGGVLTNTQTGAVYTQSIVSVTLGAFSGRQVRATVTLSGASVSLSGTFDWN